MISDIKKNKEKNVLKPRAVRFSDEQWDNLLLIANKEGLKASEVVRYAVTEFLKR